MGKKPQKKQNNASVSYTQDEVDEESTSDQSEFGALQCDLSALQVGKNLDLCQCILLDNESTVHAFYNHAMTK